MKNDFGLTGVTDKLKRSQVKGESDEGKPVTVLTDEGKLRHAIDAAKRNPRIGVYSPIISAAVEYLRETIPKYSASDEARKILEAEFEKKYPELVTKIKSGLE
jgi:hypothetical protein